MVKDTTELARTVHLARGTLQPYEVSAIVRMDIPWAAEAVSDGVFTRLFNELVEARARWCESPRPPFEVSPHPALHEPFPFHIAARPQNPALLRDMVGRNTSLDAKDNHLYIIVNTMSPSYFEATAFWSKTFLATSVAAPPSAPPSTIFSRILLPLRLVC